MTSQYSDEIINAFVDGELDGVEKENIKNAIQSDADLMRRVHATCELKKNIKQSYANIDINQFAPQVIKKPASSGWQYSIAAALMLCMGVVLGWFGNSYYASENMMVDAEELKGVKLAPVNLQQPNKIMLHLASSEQGKLKEVMDQVNHIIKEYQMSKQAFEIEVIANSDGLELVRQDISPYREEVANIIARYSNVSFIACSNALEKLRVQGIEPKLIAQTKTGVTAVEQIVKRLQEGWVYVKV